MVSPSQPFELPHRLLRETSESLKAIAKQSHRQYAFDFEPMFRLGDTVQVIKSDGIKQVRVDAVDALPYRRLDNGSTSADTVGIDFTQLDMASGEMAQYRFAPMDLFEVEFTHPSTVVRRWRSDTTNFRLPPYLIGDYPPELVRYFFAASEFWVFEDDTPRFDVYPLAGQTIQQHFDVWGWRYHLVPNNTTGEFSIRVNGWPS